MLGVSILTFGMGRLAPGDPVDTVLAGTQNPTAEEIASARAYLGLDEPIVSQYFKWLSRALSGDLGLSFQTGQPVSHELAVRLPQTMILTLGSVIVMIDLIIGYTAIQSMSSLVLGRLRSRFIERIS